MRCFGVADDDASMFGIERDPSDKGIDQRHVFPEICPQTG